MRVNAVFAKIRGWSSVDEIYLCLVESTKGINANETWLESPFLQEIDASRSVAVAGVAGVDTQRCRDVDVVCWED